MIHFFKTPDGTVIRVQIERNVNRYAYVIERIDGWNNSSFIEEGEAKTKKDAMSEAKTFLRKCGINEWQQWDHVSKDWEIPERATSVKEISSIFKKRFSAKPTPVNLPTKTRDIRKEGPSDGFREHLDRYSKKYNL